MTAAKLRAYRIAAAGALAYTVPVILWGAFVRISGSGAGCGQHWPTCRGEIVPLAPSTATVIEFTHRVTSGLCLPIVIALALGALAVFPAQHPARRAAWWGVFFMVLEAAVGAGLVLLEYVAGDTSPARAYWMAGHLLNTYLLTGAQLLALWWALDRSIPGRPIPEGSAFARGRVIAAVRGAPPSLRAFIVVGALALCVVSMTGAVTALGDTLFPLATEASLQERITGGSGAHIFERLRIVHPALAMVTAFGLIVAPWGVLPDRQRRNALVLACAAGAQVVAGIANVALSAPGWMQLVHLDFALTVWLAFVWASVEAVHDAACAASPDPGAPSARRDGTASL